jgi:hypothetical protein
MTRLWSYGKSISVIGNALNEPRRFAWREQFHQVEEITDSWRVDIDWWQERVWRDYFKLRTDTGLLVEIYCDRLTGKWYLQRLYD